MLYVIDWATCTYTGAAVGVGVGVGGVGGVGVGIGGVGVGGVGVEGVGCTTAASMNRCSCKVGRNQQTDKH